MEEYLKPHMELIVLPDDVIVTSGCGKADCGVGVITIELPAQP